MAPIHRALITISRGADQSAPRTRVIMLAPREYGRNTRDKVKLCP